MSMVYRAAGLLTGGSRATSPPPSQCGVAWVQTPGEAEAAGAATAIARAEAAIASEPGRIKAVMADHSPVPAFIPSPMLRSWTAVRRPRAVPSMPIDRTRCAWGLTGSQPPRRWLVAVLERRRAWADRAREDDRVAGHDAAARRAQAG